MSFGPSATEIESRNGKTRVVLKTANPRVGEPLEGRVRFLKEAPKPGDIYELELYCERRYRTEDKTRTERAFRAMLDVQPVQDAKGWSLPFRFDIPVTAPSTSPDTLPTGERYYWMLDFHKRKSWFALSGDFALMLAPGDPAALAAIQAKETPAQKAAIGDLAGLMGAPLLPHQRAELQALSPGDLAMARKITAMPVKIMKWLLIGFFAIPFVLVSLVFIVGWLFLMFDQ